MGPLHPLTTPYLRRWKRRSRRRRRKKRKRMVTRLAVGKRPISYPKAKSSSENVKN
jgi:hypothetical protein